MTDIKKQLVSAGARDCNGPVARRTAAGEVLDMATRIADTAEVLAGRTMDKLIPISRPQWPEEDSPAECCESLPPYYEQLRVALFRLEYHLASIDNAIERVEL